MIVNLEDILREAIAEGYQPGAGAVVAKLQEKYKNHWRLIPTENISRYQVEVVDYEVSP